MIKTPEEYEKEIKEAVERFNVDEKQLRFKLALQGLYPVEEQQKYAETHNK